MAKTVQQLLFRESPSALASDSRGRGHALYFGLGAIAAWEIAAKQVSQSVLLLSIDKYKDIDEGP